MIKKTVMFTGDSVVDADRGRPLGDWLHGLGNGFVSHIFACAWAADPTFDINILNTGTGGNTSRDLLRRYDAEVLAYKPDYVFIMVGINDCWREFDCFPTNGEMAPSVEEYKANMTEMVKKTQASGAKVALVSPYFLERDHENKMRAKCDKLNEALADISKEYGCEYISVVETMDTFIAAQSSYPLSGDRIHPRPIGKQIIANAIIASDTWKEIAAK